MKRFKSGFSRAAVTVTGIATGLVLTLTSLAPANAQNESDVTTGQMSTSQRPTDYGVASRGFRIALFKPVLSGTIEVSDSFVSGSISGEFGSSLGLSIGYARFPIDALGWSTNFAAMSISGDDSSSKSATLARLDGNIGYAFTPMFLLKGGLNISKFVGDGPARELSQLDAGVGAQISAGIQFNKNVGVDLGFVSMSQSKSYGAAKLEIREYGPELALTGTF